MWNLKSIRTILIIFIIQKHSTTAAVSDVFEIMKATVNVLELISKSWEVISPYDDFSIIPLPLVEKAEAKVFEKISSIDERLTEIGQKLDLVGSVAIDTLLKNIQESIRLELRLNDIIDLMSDIDVSYKEFIQYTNKTQGFEKFTLVDFAKTTVSHDSKSALSIMDRLHAFIVPNKRSIITDDGILNLLLKAMSEVNGDFMCNSKQSPQQILYNIYSTLMLAELKAITMGQYAYIILRIYNKGNFTREAALLKSNFQDRTNESVLVLKTAMTKASRELWPCDPETHVRGETYIEITRLLQGYVINEVNLNANSKCYDDCGDYNYNTKSYGVQTMDKCQGKTVNCIYVEANMWICPANSSSYRRYDFITYDSGRRFGPRKTCATAKTHLTSWWDWFWKCPYCFCYCDQEGRKSDRYINLRSVIADLKNNRVVTGLRFVKHNRIIHLTIQQGELLANGKINASTVEWVPPEDYHYNDRNVYREQDFHVLTYEQRAIDFDDLEVDEGYIMTGVRFKTIGSHLSFEIYTTKYDFPSGKLIDPIGTSIWKDSIENLDTRKEIIQNQVDIPTLSPRQSVPKSLPNQYLRFTHTDMEKDAGQTTVPFIDAQQVESLQPVPLGGAGVFYKGRSYYGGFIAPKIITMDYTKYMEFPWETNEII